MPTYQYDVVFIHPPAIFLEDDYPLFPIPWSLEHIGSTSLTGNFPAGPAWNTPPMGLFTMKSFVEKNSSYSAEVFNLGLVGNPLDVERWVNGVYSSSRETIKAMLRQPQADLFAVDIHWIVHSQGAIQTLKLLKEYHPQSYTVVGGFTASHFRHEIMKSFPFIDFVVIGDGSVPVVELLHQIKGKKDFSKVPNLLYREGKKIRESPRAELNDFIWIQENQPTSDSIALGRGCPLQCLHCGGSRYSSESILGYKRPQSYSIDSILDKISKVAGTLGGNGEKPLVFLVHDPFVTIGKKQWYQLLDEIKRSGIQVRLLIEFFIPHPPEDVYKIAETVPGSDIHISPESMDEHVRDAQKNRHFTNQAYINLFDTVNDIDHLGLNVWFMTGMAEDTRASVEKTLSFVKEYYSKIKNYEKKKMKYNEMLFLDPGSLGFDLPKTGYKVLYKTFAENMMSFAAPHFKYQINYRTQHLDRKQIFDLTMYMHHEMNRLYLDHGVIAPDLYRKVEKYNDLLVEFAPKYDLAFTERHPKKRAERFLKLGFSLIDRLQN